MKFGMKLGKSVVLLSTPNMDQRMVLLFHCSKNIFFSSIRIEGNEIFMVFGFSLCYTTYQLKNGSKSNYSVQHISLCYM
jgi:hypothetical protein